mmetsp:Transcript_8829/g.27403  ORF Transcript_8829/g.27403 Transcript_8829/m.27403 type:complete len:314 (+) Transcript_8829:3519-4460(+)
MFFLERASALTQAQRGAGGLTRRARAQGGRCAPRRRLALLGRKALNLMHHALLHEIAAEDARQLVQQQLGDHKRRHGRVGVRRAQQFSQEGRDGRRAQQFLEVRRRAVVEKLGERQHALVPHERVGGVAVHMHERAVHAVGVASRQRGLACHGRLKGKHRVTTRLSTLLGLFLLLALLLCRGVGRRGRLLRGRAARGGPRRARTADPRRAHVRPALHGVGHGGQQRAGEVEQLELLLGRTRIGRPRRSHRGRHAAEHVADGLVRVAFQQLGGDGRVAIGARAERAHQRRVRGGAQLDERVGARARREQRKRVV